MNKFRLAVVSAMSVALCPLSARAADALGVLAVADPPGPSPELAELTHQLRLVAAEKTKGVLEAGQIRDRMTGQTSTASLAELDRAYSGALATFQTGDFEGAVRTLRAVVEELERLPDKPEVFSQWTRAMMRLARAEQSLGRKDEARAILERLVRTAPDVKVDSTQYPPSFERQIAEIRTQIKTLATQKLTVQSSNKGAKVFVDGREVGVAPVSVHLPRGRYRISGAVGNLRVAGIMVELTEDQNVTLNFAVAEALRPTFGPGLALPEGDRAKGIITAGAFLGVDRVIAASLTSQGEVQYLIGTYYDVRRGMLLREGRVRLTNMNVTPGSLSALTSFLITGQQSTLVAATTMEPMPADSPSLRARPQEGGGYRATSSGSGSKTLGWVAVGTGVLTVGLTVFGIVENSAANSKYSQAQGMLDGAGQLKPGQDGELYNRLIRDGDSARTMSTVGFVGAGAAAVSTVVLGYLSYKQCGEIGPFRF